MPRQFCTEYPGAIHHEMNRGDRREPIFQDDTYRKLSSVFGVTLTNDQNQLNLV